MGRAMKNPTPFSAEFPGPAQATLCAVTALVLVTLLVTVWLWDRATASRDGEARMVGAAVVLVLATILSGLIFF